MRVLVLGGTFFVGKAIVEYLLARGHEVTLHNRGVSRPTAGEISHGRSPCLGQVNRQHSDVDYCI
jgi:2'-hydroxyisoflavone reductase